MVCVVLITYMCACTYSSLFKVKFLDYKLVPEHHSDEGSLLFVGSYLWFVCLLYKPPFILSSRLTFPLSYNFLRMVKDEDNSIFVQV